MSGAHDLSYDPYDFAIHVDPHPVWRRMRDEGPTEKELADAKLYLTGSYALRFGSTPRSRVAEPRIAWPAGVGGRERQTIDAYLQLPPKKRELVGELVKALSDGA